MSEIIPNLYNPAQIIFEREDQTKTRYDHRRRTPINVVARKQSFTIEGQVVWSVSQAESAPEMSQAGETERDLGYVLLRTMDLTAQGQSVKKDDKISSIAGMPQEFFVTRLQYGSHYNGIFRLVKVFYSDRKGQTNG